MEASESFIAGSASSSFGSTTSLLQQAHVDKHVSFTSFSKTRHHEQPDEPRRAVHLCLGCFVLLTLLLAVWRGTQPREEKMVRVEVPVEVIKEVVREVPVERSVVWWKRSGRAKRARQASIHLMSDKERGGGGEREAMVHGPHEDTRTRDHTSPHTPRTRQPNPRRPHLGAP